MLLNQNPHTVCNREYQKSRNLRYLNKMQFCFLHSVMCIQIKKCQESAEISQDDRGKSTKAKLF
jgi:hypothetical protein